MSADHDLVCNFRKCRKALKSSAWVTSCSHIFCDEHGVKEFQKSATCPACDTALAGKYDILRIDVQPTEQYKSMVLAGQKPETIMDVCTRAMSFWTYQSHQERAYHEYVSSKVKERSIQQEQYYEQLISTIQTELSNTKTQLSSVKKEMESLKQQYSESQEKMLEKGRQYQKLQLMYDAMRRKIIKFDQGDVPPQLTPRLNRAAYNMDPFLSVDDILLRGSQPSREHNHANGSGDHRNSMNGTNKTFGSPCRPGNGFIFKPNITPVLGTASGPGEHMQVHRKS